MSKLAQSFCKTATPDSPVAVLSTSDLADLAERWLDACDGQFHSERTIEARRSILDKLLWFLRHVETDQCGTREVEKFLAYLRHGHKESGGRWDNPQMTRPVRPRTVKDYYGHLRTFFRWCVAQGELAVSPCERITPPTARADQVQPFTEAEVRAMLAAARAKTAHPRRNEAILTLLHDCGLRASELCGLTVGDVDLGGCTVTVLGKGNKHRRVPFGRVAKRALYQYLAEQRDRRPVEDDSPMFTSDRGRRASGSEPLTRSGLLQMIERIGAAAGVRDTHPHRWRHTFAVDYLRAGGNVFALQRLLGHTSLSMTNRYVALAQTDLQAQHREFSPADRLRRCGG